MPVAAFVGQILGESKSILMETPLQSFYPLAPPRNKVKNREHCTGYLQR